MKKTWIWIIAWLIIINIETIAPAQQPELKGQLNSSAYMYVPKEIVLPLVVSQPESPLTIKEISIYIRDNKVEYFLSVKNNGEKAIKGFGYGIIGKQSGSLYSFTAKPQINPNQTVNNTLDKEAKVIALTPETKQIFKIYDNGRLQETLFFMITEIEFADGSNFNDLRTFDLLEKFRQEN